MTGTASEDGEKSTPPPVKEQRMADRVTGTAPKPWSCNRARLFVKESNKERPKRLVRYAQEKQAAVNGIMRSPSRMWRYAGYCQTGYVRSGEGCLTLALIGRLSGRMH